MPKSKIAHRMSVRVGFKDGALELVVINKDTNQIMCERIPIEFGKPLDNGNVDVTVSTPSDEGNEIKEAEGNGN